MKRIRIDESLSEHPLMKRLLYDVMPFAKAAGEALNTHVKRSRHLRLSNPPTILQTNEQYRVDVFTSASTIIFSAEHLEICKTFVQRFPSPKTYQKRGIGRHTWLEYHFGYYIIIMVSLSDLALILTNDVFRLGNPEKKCRPDIIKKNRYVCGTPVKEGLDALDNLIEPYRPIRNCHVHWGKKPDLAEIVKSDLLDDLMLMSSVSLMSKSFVLPEFVNSMFEGQTDDIVARMTGELDRLKAVVSDLFNSLLPIYQMQVKAMDKERST